MVTHCRSLLLIMALVFALANPAASQLGPAVIKPEYNSTVNPGEKITIEYEYQNMGTGDYVVKIDLWEDSGRRTLLQNVEPGKEIEGGNSTGVQISFNYSATYDWKVPKGLTHKVHDIDGNEVEESIPMFYLTVTTIANTEYWQNLSLSSRPVRLHYNAGALTLPASKLLLLALAVPVSLFYFAV
ncbi:hypothetical protein BJV82DRAFT_165016 [Fennellomyces sp. T-0311]|nr:hypothetical protein BJV82DRAFT_165016 [Fennellomyces sp. T-0311]